MTIDTLIIEERPDPVVAGRSAVSWPAIIAGAVVAVATSLVLLAIGSGFGLAVASPWANAGATALTLSVGAAIWLIVIQWVSSAAGGYLTGRLRTRWRGVHTHEVFFRDTAHGFLAWSLATVVTAALLSSAAAMSIGAGAHAMFAGAAMSHDHGAPPDGVAPPLAYDVDFLFRGSHPADPTSAADAHMQAARILEAGVKNAAVPTDDAAYLGQLVVTQTGLAPADAQQRVATVVTREQAAVVQAKQAADKARETVATLSILTALSMLIGALIASLAAALGGQLRDEHL
jgi:hypothetical protein